MSRPTIFISSTVLDFGDLRSAMKDYLEARGCTVLASEYPDFPKALDKHSYEECLNTLERADLFVLLIGRRRGGWHDETNRISITRAEFERAVKLAEQGRMKILCFVRQEVWDHRQSVKDLRAALVAEKKLDAAAKKKLTYHPSEFMDDPEAIIAFIDAVARNQQTMLASRGKGKPPIANWIHPFSTFAQIRQAIDPLVTSGLTVREAAGRKALEAQLEVLLQGLLATGKEGPHSPYFMALGLAETLGLRVEALGSKIRLDKQSWSRLFLLAIRADRAEADPAPLLPALSSDLLLQYDPAAGTFRRTAEYDLLVNVVDQIRRFTKADGGALGELVRAGQPADASEARSIPSEIAAGWLHLILRWADLIASARALARSLGGGPLTILPALPRSPFQEQEEDFADEEVTLDAVRTFVSNWPAELDAAALTK
jgi:hypothetical protein